MAATTDGEAGEKKCVMINNVSRAYSHARATRKVYVEAPPEDRSPGDGDASTGACTAHKMQLTTGVGRQPAIRRPSTS